MDIRESYEPEFLFGLKKKSLEQKPQRVYITENGDIIPPKIRYQNDFHSKKSNTNFNQGGFASQKKTNYTVSDAVTDTTDAAIDAAIISDIMTNGEKGAQSIFDHAKDVFDIGKAAETTPIIDDAAVESTSGIFDGLSNMMDNIGDGLSDFVSSIGDSLGDIL